MNKDYNLKVYEDMDDDCRKCVVIIALDDSGSMSPKEEVVFQATKQLLQMLAKENESSIDFEFRVILMVFNNDVHVINTNSIPLPPEQLLELFDRKDYIAHTNIGVICWRIKQFAISRQTFSAFNCAKVI